MFLSFVLICIIFTWLPDTSTGQTQTDIISAPANTGEFIIRTVINRAKENDVIKKEKLTYKLIYTVNNLNNNEQVTDTEKQETILVEKGGKEQALELMRNGRPINKGNKISMPRFELLKILEAMIRLDDFIVEKIEPTDDRLYYIVTFKPKPKQKTTGDAEEVIVRSEGKMYVDIEKFYIKKLSAWLTKTYSRVGMLGMNIFNLRRANIEIEQEELDGIIVMKSAVIIDKYSLFGVETFEKQSYSYKDYQK
jgi:hypothetical protein